jgi:hypothetical protein
VGWATTLSLYCDGEDHDCGDEVTLEGRSATKRQVVAVARLLGWKVSTEGYATCPRHTRRGP